MLGPGAASFPKLPPNLNGVKRTRTTNTTSLGIEAFDKLIEDGIPFPSIVLIDERRSKKYSRILTRLFIAEGIKTGQKIWISESKRGESEELLNSIPSEMSGPATSSDSQVKPRIAEDSMKIAWRYNTAPQVGVQSTSREKFDLAKSLPRSDIDSSKIKTCYYNSIDVLEEDLFKELKEFDISKGSLTTALRICLPNLTSILISSENLVSFLVKLRAYVFSSASVAMITIDGDLVDEKTLKLICSLCDTAFTLYSNPSDTPGGRLEIIKFPRCYGSAPLKRENCDFNYKDTRHTVELRRIHLDPEGLEQPEDSNAPLLPKLKELGVLATDDAED